MLGVVNGWRILILQILDTSIYSCASRIDVVGENL